MWGGGGDEALQHTHMATQSFLNIPIGVRHVHMTKISIYMRVYTNSNGDSLKLEYHSLIETCYIRVLNNAVWSHIRGTLYHN